MTSSDLTETFCYELADLLEHIYPFSFCAMSDFLSTSHYIKYKFQAVVSSKQDENRRSDRLILFRLSEILGFVIQDFLMHTHTETSEHGRFLSFCPKKVI